MMMWLGWIFFVILTRPVEPFHFMTNRKHVRSVSILLLHEHQPSQKSFNKDTSTTTTTNSRTNHKVRRLLDQVLSRLHQKWDETKWSRLRSYLYRNQDKLTEEQVQNVLDFLLQHCKDETDVACILQQSPRILRKNAKTHLEPTYQFLQELYGDSLLSVALQRNPDLLLTRGAGYEGGVFELVEIFLKEELKLSPRHMANIKKNFPVLFQTPVSKLLSTVYLFRNQLKHLSHEDSTAAIAKLVHLHPQVFVLSVERLNSRITFLQQQCGLDIESILRNAGSLLGLSVEDNLKPKFQLLAKYIPDREKLAIAFKSHPQILGLSRDNLQAKLSYFDDVDSGRSGKLFLDDSLASRVLLKATPVFSLSLEKNITPKIDFLAKVWGVDDAAAHSTNRTTSTDASSRLSRLPLAEQLRQYPSILSLSLEGNLQPTTEFYNKTNYIELDGNWRLQPSSAALRGRDLAASLSNRLLPRWHFCHSKKIITRQDDNDDGSCQRTIRKELPLHVLVSATDSIFCEELSLNATEYSIFKREAIPRLKFSSQFDTWVKTGRPIDV